MSVTQLPAGPRNSATLVLSATCSASCDTVISSSASATGAHVPSARRNLAAAASPAVGAGTRPLVPPAPASPTIAVRAAVASAAVKNLISLPVVVAYRGGGDA